MHRPEYTLAELLIALVILGIITAFAIPGVLAENKLWKVETVGSNKWRNKCQILKERNKKAGGDNQLFTHLNKVYKIHISTNGSALENKPADYYQSMVAEAFQQWNQALDDHLNYQFVPNEADAIIIIRWVDAFEQNSPYQKAGDAGLIAGIGRIRIQSGHDRTETIHTILHEIGHILGMAHTNNLEDVMYSPLSLVEPDLETYKMYTHPLTKLSKNDVSTIRCIYAIDY